MQNIIAFFIRNRIFFLFLLLLFVSLGFTIQSHSYHRSKFINSANWLTGGVYASVNDIASYFDLKTQNEWLLEENRRLRDSLHNSFQEIPFPNNTQDSTHVLFKYRIVSATVIKNSYSATKNYLTINKGAKDGISRDMGVVSSKGLVGIVENTSSGYAVVQSALNTLTEINASVQRTGQFGSLKWDRKDPSFMQLTDIPKIANPQVGDTIVTGGMSAIFPKGILIGRVHSFELDSSENYYTLQVALFNDMTRLEHLYIIENTHKNEIQTLEESVLNE